MRRLTFFRASAKRRSRIFRDVTYSPSRPPQGEVLTPKIIAIVGSSTRIGGSGTGALAVGDGVADVDLLDAGDRDDVAGARARHLAALEAVPGVEQRDLAGHLRAVGATERVLAAGRELAGDQPPDGEPADVVVVVEVVHLELRRRVRDRRAGPGRRSTMVSKSSSSVVPVSVGRVQRDAGAGVRVDDREVELLRRRRRGR